MTPILSKSFSSVEAGPQLRRHTGAFGERVVRSRGA